jgi:hypothetical protein
MSEELEEYMLKCRYCAEGYAWMRNGVGQCDMCGEVLYDEN